MINAPARKLTPTSYFAYVARTALYVVPSSTGNVTLTPAAASLVFTGQTPTVVNTGSNTLTPAAATLSLTGNTPTIALTDNKILSPAASSISINPGRPVLYLNGIPQLDGIVAIFKRGLIVTDIIQPVVREVIQ